MKRRKFIHFSGLTILSASLAPKFLTGAPGNPSFNANWDYFTTQKGVSKTLFSVPEPVKQQRIGLWLAADLQ